MKRIFSALVIALCSCMFSSAQSPAVAPDPPVLMLALGYTTVYPYLPYVYLMWHRSASVNAGWQVDRQEVYRQDNCTGPFVARHQANGLDWSYRNPSTDGIVAKGTYCFRVTACGRPAGTKVCTESAPSNVVRVVVPPM